MSPFPNDGAHKIYCDRVTYASMEKPSTHDTASRATSRIGKIELPWLILAALLISTLLAAFQSSRQLRADADMRFAEIAQGEKRTLIRQLRDVDNILQGARAFHKALPNLSQSAWDTYLATRLRDVTSNAGLVAIDFVPGTILSVDSGPKPSRTDDSAPINDVRASSTSLPMLDALGRAASMNGLVMSGPLPLPAGAPTSTSRVALVLPLDARTTISLNSVADTQAQRSVVAIVDLATIVSSLTRDPAYAVGLELFDGDKRLFPARDMTAADDFNAEMTTEIPVEFGRRTLRLKVLSTPQLEKSLHSNMPRAILVIGIFGTMMLGALVLLLTRLRAQAESLAASMTRELQDQTRFTEDLIEFNPNPIFRKDAAGRFVVVNLAWEQLSGRSRKDVLGKTNREFQRAEVTAQNEIQDTKLLESESGYDASEVFITNANGQQFETIIAKKVLKRADGTIDGMIGTITDVTLIKKLERELARQREQLDLVIRSSQQGIWDIDLSEGGVSYFSDRFREILGYTEVDFPTIFNWRDHTHPDDTDEVYRRVIAHFKGATSLFDIEPRIKRRDNSYMWVRVRAIAQRDAASRVIRFVGSIADVTDRKMAEVELTAANIRVTEAARAKESFLATMSHEIRTPLNGVLGMTSLLSETVLNDEQHDYIRLIRASGDTLLRLIDDVLDFSKIESGHMTLESVTVEIVTVVEEAFELVADKAREKKLALLFEMHEDVPFYILGDATRLRQILLNLLSNAIKFTAKGEIRLELSTRARADGQLELEGRITDTGIGIPAARVSKLFQPFTQVDASTTRKYGGTGLGLAIVRRLSQLMGGDVRVESIEGQGSTFIFTVSTSAAHGPQKPYMQKNVAEFVNKRLLVVERNANRRIIQQRRCSWWGFDTVTATPEEALRVLSAGPPFDVLLTEMTLSSSDLLALHKAIELDDIERLRVGRSPVSVILQSGVSRAELSQRQHLAVPRHDAFIMRPAGRGRIFDVLMRAVLHQPNVDVLTRPFSTTLVYEAQSRARLSNLSADGARSPLDSTPGKAPRELPVVKIRGRAPNILVAEDNEVNQRVVLGMLKNLGCRSDLAVDGNSAVKKAATNRYDVILMDIHMPELDGVTAMQNIRTFHASGGCPPIVAMTANALPGDREHYLSLGMNDYISKPIRTGDLKRLFERLFPRNLAEVAPPLEQIVSRPTSPISAVATVRTKGLPILDIEQLEDLRYLPAPDSASGDTESVGGLIRLFQTTANERMDEMERLLASGQWARLSEVAHSLCGSSASLGYPRVAANCKELELAARRKQSDADSDAPTQQALDDFFALIKFHYWEADAALQQWLTATVNSQPSP